MTNLLRSLRDNDSGAAIVEMALTAPILAVLLIGMVDMSRGYSAKLQLELLARRAKKLGDDGAREKLSEPAEVVRAEINRLASLLDEFLDMARPRQIERRPVSLAELFDEVSRLEEPLLQKSQVALTTRVEPPELSVRPPPCGDAAT